MRPSKSGGSLKKLKNILEEKKRSILLAVVVILAIGVLAYGLYSIDFRGDYFEKLELEDETISPGGETELSVLARNVDDQDWDDFGIKVRTQSSKLEITRLGQELEEENDWYVIETNIDALRAGESDTSARGFDIKAGELSPGEKYVGLIIEVAIIAEGEEKASEELTLRISN